MIRSHLRTQCRDDNEIDDVIQETLLRAARYRATLAHPERLVSWTLRIAGNVFRDMRRREGRLSRSEVDEVWLEQVEGREAPPGDPGETVRVEIGSRKVELGAALLQLRAALVLLKVEDRRVLHSYYGGDETCRTTARDCSILPSLVKVRLFRARRRLARALRRTVALNSEVVERSSA